MIWTEEETQRLRDLYPLSTNKQLLEALAPRLWDSIYKRARQLKLLRGVGYRPWTADEDAALLLRFPKGTLKEIKEAVPRRSKEAIQKRARILNVKSEKGFGWRAWTESEIRLLRQYYAVKSRAELEVVLAPRSWHAIMQEAKSLKLRRRIWMSIRGDGTTHPLLKQIRQRRIAAGVTQDALAKVAGYDGSTLQRIEYGDGHTVKLSTLEDIALALGMKLQLVSLNQPDLNIAPRWLIRLVAEMNYAPRSRKVIKFENITRDEAKRARERAA